MQSKTASIYSREYEKMYSRKFWMTPRIHKKFFSLDSNLRNLGIDPEEYVMYCIRRWKRFAENKSMTNVMVNVDNLCSVKSIEKYVAADPISDRTYVYSVLSAIEDAVAIGTIRAYLEMEESGEKNFSSYQESIDSWRENEIGVCYDENCTYEEAIRKYPGMYDRVVEHAAISACSHFGVRFEFADYDYIARQVLSKRRDNARAS